MRSHERHTTEATTLVVGLVLVLVGLLLAALGPAAVLAAFEAVGLVAGLTA